MGDDQLRRKGEPCREKKRKWEATNGKERKLGVSLAQRKTPLVFPHYCHPHSHLPALWKLHLKPFLHTHSCLKSQAISSTDCPIHHTHSKPTLAASQTEKETMGRREEKGRLLKIKGTRIHSKTTPLSSIFFGTWWQSNLLPERNQKVDQNLFCSHHLHQRLR